MEIELDLRKSVIENAQEYYTKAKKLHRKIEGLLKALQETEHELREWEEGKKEIEKKIAKPELIPREKKKKKWYEKFRWFVSTDGFLVVGGKDATSNEILIKKYTEASDIIFHADIHGSPFFVVKVGDKNEVPATTLQQTAQATASYSSAWKVGRGSVDVYWVLPEQVSKRAPAGEYIVKGAFMIRGKKQYIRKVPLQLAIGFKIGDGEEVKVIGGPENAVKTQTSLFTLIIPGDMKSGSLAKEIRERIAKIARKEEREKIIKVPLQEIQQWIPGGRGQIKEK